MVGKEDELFKKPSKTKLVLKYYAGFGGPVLPGL
jgi:hypothetical protein